MVRNMVDKQMIVRDEQVAGSGSDPVMCRDVG